MSLFSFSSAPGKVAATAYAGGTASYYAGDAWDTDPSMKGGAIAGAAAAIGILAGRGGYRSIKAISSIGAKTWAKREYNAGNLLAPALIGAGAGVMAGPTDSTFGNMMIGAAGGLGGAGMARQIISRVPAGMKNISLGGNRVGKIGTNAGKLKIGYTSNSTLRKKGDFGKSIKVSNLGAGAGALFSAGAAHATLGSSRRDKSQNQLNRF